LDDGIVERRYLVDATIRVPLIVVVNGQDTLGGEFIGQWRDILGETLRIELPVAFTCHGGRVTVEAWDVENAEIVRCFDPLWG